MDFIEVVRNHRSVREYTTKLIEGAQIERLKARIMLRRTRGVDSFGFLRRYSNKSASPNAVRKPRAGCLQIFPKPRSTPRHVTRSKIPHSRCFMAHPHLSLVMGKSRKLKLLEASIWLQKTCCWQLVMKAVAAAGLASHVPGFTGRQSSTNSGRDRITSTRRAHLTTRKRGRRQMSGILQQSSGSVKRSVCRQDATGR